MAVVDPTTAAIGMAGHLANIIARIQEGVPPATAHLGGGGLAEVAVRIYREARVRGALAVLSRMPEPEAESYVRTALEDCGIPVLGVFPDHWAIQGQWLRGQALRSTRLAGAAREVARELEALVAGVAP
jgi:hypothetical protein